MLILKLFLTILLIIAVLLNIFGIYLLTKCKQMAKVHRIHLLVLSGTACVVSALHLIQVIGESFVAEKISLRFIQIIVITNLGVVNAYYFNLLVLSFSRVFSTYNPFSYRRICTARKTLTSIWISCVLGMLLVTPLYFLQYRYAYQIHLKYILLPLDGVFLIIVLCAYFFIFSVLIKRRRHFSTTMRTDNSNLKFLKVFFLIMLSFTLFLLIPDTYYVVQISIYNKITCKEGYIVSVFWFSSYIFDPLIYNFILPNVRKLVKRIFKKRYINDGCVQSASLRRESAVKFTISDVKRENIQPTFTIFNRNATFLGKEEG